MTKDFILKEIKRTATANGGVPLGRARFTALTGIKECDWSGRFWARWSDAVLEAGFQPNQMQAAYEAADLLKHMVAIIRRIQKFPTAAELQLEARMSPGFPSYKTFSKLGNRSETAQKIAEYCETDPELEPVAAICRNLVAKQTIEELSDDDVGDETYGYVYLIKAGKHHKIGKTNSIGRRVGQLKIQLPDKAELIHQITTDDPTGIEAYWHGRFREKRLNGEWFALTRQDITAFKRRKFM